MSVENSGFKNVLQACVDLGAKYGKFDVGEILAGLFQRELAIAHAVID